MKESRVFELNQVTAEQVLEAVTTFLRGEKGMDCLLYTSDAADEL